MKTNAFFTTRLLRICFSVLILICGGQVISQVVHYNWPTGNGQAITSDRYRVFVSYGNDTEEEVTVLMSNATGNGDWQWADLQGRTFSYVNLSYNNTGNNSLTIRVEKIFGGNASDVNVYPGGYGINPSIISGTEVSFEVDANQRYFSVHFESSDNTTGINGWVEHMLGIFIDPVETDLPNLNASDLVYYSNSASANDISNAGTIYFSAGYHNLNDYTGGGIIDSDGVLTIQPDQHIYLEGGAFVEGLFDVADNAEAGQKVYGRGILSGRQYMWSKDPNHTGREYKEILNVGTEAIIEGISVVESPHHGIVGGNKATIKNMKYIGWHGNNDGVRVGRNSEISHSFFRAVDDHFYNFDIYVHDCVLWAGHNGAILTYGWGGVEGSNTYNSGSSIMEDIDIIHPEWVSLGNNNGIVASQVGLDYKPYEYDDSTMTVLRNFVVEGSIPGIVNLKPRSESLESIAIQVTESTVGYLGDLTIENFQIDDVFASGLIAGETNATTDGNSSWLVKNISFNDVEIDGTCLTTSNVNNYITVDSYTSEDISFTCGGVVESIPSTPSDVSDLQATVISCNTVALSWSDIDFEDEYRVRRRVLDAQGNVIESYTNLTDLPAGTTSYTDNTADESTIYQYVVRPVQNDVAVATSNRPEVETPSCSGSRISQSVNEEVTKSPSVSIYPNPVVGNSINVMNIEGLTQYSIMDLSGKKLIGGNLMNGKIDVTSLVGGVYMLELASKETMIRIKLIRE